MATKTNIDDSTDCSMKEKIQFDKNIADRLNNYESAVNPQMWDRINQGLDESPKRAFPFWLFFGVITFVSLASVTTYYYLQSDESIITESLIIENTNAKIDVVKTASSQNIAEKKNTNQLATNQKEAKPISGVTNTDIQAEELFIDAKEILPSGSIHVSNIKHKEIKKETKDQNTYTRSTTALQTNTTPTHREFNTSGNLIQKQTSKATSSLIMQVEDSGISMTSLNTLDLPFKLQWKPPFKNPEPSGCYDFGKNNSFRYLLDLYIAPQYSFKSLEDPSGTMASHIASRDTTEKSLLAYTVGGRASIAMSNGLALRAGLSYTEIQERFDLDIANEMKTIIEIDVITNGMGDTTRIDTTTFIQTGTRKIRRFNYLRSFDVPVMLGYSFDVGNIALEFNAGAIFNIHFRSRGTFLSPFIPGQIASYTKGDPEYIDVYKSNIGISYYGSAAVSIPINPKFDFLIEPHVRYTPKSITTATYAVDQKHLLTGAAFVLRYKL